MYLYESAKDVKIEKGMNDPSFTRMIMGANTRSSRRLPFWKKAAIELYLYRYYGCVGFSFNYYYDNEELFRRALYSYGNKKMRVR